MNEELMDKRDEMLQVAMQIIMNAGDARMCSLSALRKLRTFEFCAAKRLMAEAREKMLLAHNAQTDLIQKEAAGEFYECSLIFNHAQDTLMTSKSQMEMAEEMCVLFQILYERTEGGF